MFDEVHITPSARLVVLTGAGISAESGVPTFRDAGGIWQQVRIEDVAAPEAFTRNPSRVWAFYNERRKMLGRAQPNPAHHALARLDAAMNAGRFTLITQNVDDLHQRAGARRIFPMHGELAKVRCVTCHAVTETFEALPELPRCPCGGLLRPDVVWFGEIPRFLDEISAAVGRCSHFLVVGTSGVVYPAAGFLDHARAVGATTLGINLEPPDNVGLIQHFYQGRSGQIVPALVDVWIADLGR